MSAHWEHFEHGADVGVRGLAGSKAGAFEQAALALTAVIADPGSIEPREPVEFVCDAHDDEELLVDWLNALVYEMAVRAMLFSRFQVAIEGSHLTATALGEPISLRRHRPAVEVKGATFTGLRVAHPRDDLWIAQTVVDV